MDPTQVGIALAYAEIKDMCEHLGKLSDDLCEPGEKMLAKHILTIMERNLREAREEAKK